MNHVYIIGNLTAGPKTATTAAGKQVTNFTVAVNRRQSAQAGQPEAISSGLAPGTSWGKFAPSI